MQKHLQLEILAQPDDTTCGPTCLHSVYQYYRDDVPLHQVVQESSALQETGTLAVLLGDHALKRGYAATIYTFNLTVFDPTWFLTNSDLVERLEAQMAAKQNTKLHVASKAYIEFLKLGGEIRMQDLNAALIIRYLKSSIPILTGLSATYLYGCEREIEPDCRPDDIHGVPTGHFVVLSGYDVDRGTVRVADPYQSNPSGDHYYEVKMDRLVCAILLGVLTYDANLLIIQPRRRINLPEDD
jgi:hypothetical protein